MANRGLFITGTDTGCGKTAITLALMRLLQEQGYRVLGMKPVATGSERASGGSFNEDALRIQEAGSLDVPYELINPYAYAPPIAPHIAAAEAGSEIETGVIRTCFEALVELADLVIVEGVGGWRVPLGPDLEVADLPGLLGIPALLVVGLRLGCLNHALLSAEGVLEQGCGFAGWVANRLDPALLRPEQSLATLVERIPAPCLGSVPHLPGRIDAVEMARSLDALAIGELFGGGAHA
jgi:dethiobiotin synthetase